MDVGQTIIAALKAVDQFGVIESQQMKQRGIEIMHMHRILGDIETKFIRRSIHTPRLDPAPC